MYDKLFLVEFERQDKFNGKYYESFLHTYADNKDQAKNSIIVKSAKNIKAKRVAK